MIDETLVNLSRLQFGFTAMYHFLFVPLTLGLAFILAIMESVYVMSGKIIYKIMTQFWGKLFAINFVMGVATGITLEFQFGTNWAYYAHYVGDVFGVPLALEGIIAFFLESTLVGIFIFGWDRLSKVQHLVVTWLIALGSSLSALWILIANAWMQNPVGTEFNYDTLRMELVSLSEVFFNPVAQVKFVHTVAAGYVTGALFVLGISSYYLLNNRFGAFARRSFAVAAGFGLASILSVIILGDESGYTVGLVQKVKLAAIESEWETQPPPASFTLFGIPNDEKQTTDYAIHIPYALGLIATRSVNTPVLGLKDLIAENEHHIREGIIAYKLLQQMRQAKARTQAGRAETPSTPLSPLSNTNAKKSLTPPENSGNLENLIDTTSENLRKQFQEKKHNLGYGLLLKRYTSNIEEATEEHIKKAALNSVPKSAPLFWTFRIMVGAGMWMLLLFILAFYYNAKRNIEQHRWLLWLALFSIPVPWIAIECGWFVAEYGRQPWAIAEILPTFLGTSSISANHVLASLIGFVVLYTFLLILELYLMFKYARLGPASVQA